MEMKIRIRKEGGLWKTYFVYNYHTGNKDDEYEVFMDKYVEYKEALAVSLFVVGLDRKS